MALFAQYAMAAAQEAVEDAGLDKLSDADREKVVCIGVTRSNYFDTLRGCKRRVRNRQP
jgi:3-oxoacyl-(acyl-carrier-protein) synthase